MTQGRENVRFCIFFRPRPTYKFMLEVYMSVNKLQILTVDDIAEILKMKKSWVRQRVHKDEIPYYKIGNLVRFNLRDISQWLEGKREIR